jgi:hypothetical protein
VTPSTKTLRGAFAFSARSIAGKDTGEALLYGLVCLEALLGPKGDPREPAATWLKRTVCPALDRSLGQLEDVRYGRERVERVIDESCKARNTYVHNGRCSLSPAKLMDWHDLIRLVLRHELKELVHASGFAAAPGWWV